MVDPDPPDAVLNWRTEQFVSMGFEKVIAGYLAQTRTDLHAMGDLLSRGCSHELAMQILVEDPIQV